MKQQYTPLATVICKWLKLHWLDRKKAWVFGGERHAPCKLCGSIISRRPRRGKHMANHDYDTASMFDEVSMLDEQAGFYGRIGGAQAEPDFEIRIGNTKLPVVLNHTLPPGLVVMSSGDEMALAYRGRVEMFNRQFLEDWLQTQAVKKVSL